MATKQTKKSSGSECCVSIRFVVILLAVLCPVVCYISRLNLSIAITAMVKNNTLSDLNDTSELPIPTKLELIDTPKLDNQNNKETKNENSGDSINKDKNVDMVSAPIVDGNPSVRATSRKLPPVKIIVSESSQIDLKEIVASSKSYDNERTVNEEAEKNKEIVKSSQNHSSADTILKNFTAKQNVENNIINVVSSCPQPIEDGQIIMPIMYGPKYDWNADERGHLLGAFFITYVLCQIPMARLAEILGAKWVMAGAGFGSAFLSFIAPWAASTHVYLFAFTRALMGACQTAIYPAGYILFSKWLPPTERSIALSLLIMGAYVGSVVSSTGTGFLCESEIGWPSVFYLSGVICSLWSVAWIIFASSEPQQSHWITIHELDYIQTNIENLATNNNNDDNKANIEIGGKFDASSPSETIVSVNKKVPSWKKILTNKPVWIMVVTIFSSNWSFAIVILTLPTYLNKVLHLSLSRTGVIISILYLLFCIASPIVGSVSTMMIQTRTFGLTRLQVRKLFEGIALIGQSVCFILIPWMGCDTNLVIATLFIQIVLYAFINGGEVQLASELTLDFSGTVYALANSFGSSTGFIVPMILSLIVKDDFDPQQWGTFYYFASFVTLIGGIIFILFGRNDFQDFEDDSASSKKKKPSNQQHKSPSKNNPKYEINQNDLNLDDLADIDNGSKKNRFINQNKNQQSNVLVGVPEQNFNQQQNDNNLKLSGSCNMDVLKTRHDGLVDDLRKNSSNLSSSIQTQTPSTNGRINSIKKTHGLSKIHRSLNQQSIDAISIAGIVHHNHPQNTPVVTIA